MEGATVIGTAQVVFVSGRPDAASGQPTITYSPPGVAPLDLTLDFSKDVTSVPAGALSTLKYVSHNGVPPGDLSDVSFDTSGTMLLTYSSGETVKGFQLLLARFDTLAAVAARGDNQFDAIQGSAWRHGVAGSDGFGSVKGGSIEISNVDLAQQFSDIVIMQRGYQAASQVISTANEMLQQLFSMRGK
jgi:flagellar hook protein FlgE